MSTITIKDPVSNNNVSVHVNSSTEIDGGMYYDVDYTARTSAEVDCRFAVIDYYDGNMVCQNDWQGAFVDIDEIADAQWVDCTPTDEPDELSITEAAEILGVSRQAVHSLIKRGRLEARKVGNAWMISRNSVAARLSNR
jgi:excisionase family DNA binding protein